MYTEFCSTFYTDFKTMRAEMHQSKILLFMMNDQGCIQKAHSLFGMDTEEWEATFALEDKATIIIIVYGY